MNYELKIQDVYISNIKEGIKKNEYRLNEKKLEKLKIGDTLTLISSFNKVNNVIVRVKDINKYPSWKKAIQDDWNNDFKGIFNTLEETLIGCSKFYSKDLVDKYGIIKVAIEPIKDSFIDYDVLGIKRIKFKELDLNDTFFNTLREDYIGFDRWFMKKANNEEDAYVYIKDNKIAGFLYLKIEKGKDNDVNPNFISKTRLKVGTFKINSELAKGFRLGERFLKIIFDNALIGEVEEIYITLFENKRKEVEALKEKYLIRWGFNKWGYKKSTNESVFVKKMNLYDETKKVQYNFPNHRNDFKMYFLPILSKYHTNLFPDMILKTEEKEKYNKEFGNLYSLNKIYVSNAYNANLVKPGDLVVIYRIGDNDSYKKYSSVCTGLAIIEEICFPTSLDEYLNLCSNKSVFSNDELNGFYNINKYRTVIKLIPLRTYSKKIILQTLREKNICAPNSGPRPFEIISKEFIDYFYYNK